MAGGESFDMAEEFAGVDFNDKRLEKRPGKTMENLARDPQRSIYGSCANRPEAKAVYNLSGNKKFDLEEVLRAHRAATIRRMEGHPLIFSVQDTTSVNYNNQERMEGNGYIAEKTMGVNIHTCLAVTPEGLVPGAPAQTGFNLEEPANTGLTEAEQRNRPIDGEGKFPPAYGDGAGGSGHTEKHQGAAHLRP